MIAAGTITNDIEYLGSEVDILRTFTRACRKPRLRSMLEFAEQEIVIPEGPVVGTKYRAMTQPFSAALLREFDSGRWNRCAVTGCVQSGKTFSALVIPLLYYIFEKQENVIVGVPQMEVAEDKWKKEFLPAIKSVPKFAALLPDKGKGSKGGKFESLTFKNNVTVKFMSGRGGDEKRSGYTARVALLTEVDKYDTAGEASRETDPITQIESRTRAWADRAMIILECTVSVKAGRIWTEYENGSASKLMTQCPGCKTWNHLGRKDFKGFEAAENERMAAAAAFVCPECNHKFTDNERIIANRGLKVCHGEQTIVDNEVVGELPPTNTLGFRWDAFNNLFWPSAFLGQEEFKEGRTLDDEDTSKEGIQFRWALPWSDGAETIHLKPEDVQKRVSSFGRGVLPEGTSFVTIGIDVNKPVLHWSAIAWLVDGTSQVIDYGKKSTEADKFGEDIGYRRAIRWLYEHIGTGWSNPDYLGVVIDSRYQSHMIYQAVEELDDDRWHMYFGCGSGHMENTKYTSPKTRQKNMIDIGRRCHSYTIPDQYGGVVCVNADANEWKTELHERFARGRDGRSEGAMSLFSSMNQLEHKTFARHITAESLVEKFVAGIGLKRVWIAKRKANHWLDSTYMQLPFAMLNGFEFKRRAIVIEECFEPDAEGPLNPRDEIERMRYERNDRDEY